MSFLEIMILAGLMLASAFVAVWADRGRRGWSLADKGIPKLELGNETQKVEELARKHLVVRDREPMDEAMLQAALSQLTDAHPSWIAVNQVLQDQIDNAVAQVGSVQLASDPGALAHTAGGIEWLRALQLALLEARAGRSNSRRMA